MMSIDGAEPLVKQDFAAFGLAGGGPSPFGPKDRSRFLDRLDAVLRAALRGG